MADTATGPLAGVRIVEFAGIGPAPFAAMMLADMGAEVIRLARPGDRDPARHPVLLRGRPSVTVDLKNPSELGQVQCLLDGADGLIEGFRPGVMERLGLGPDVVIGRNQKLVYGRMTGWGQTGPLAHAAGHDINYIAPVGVLAAIGPAEQPMPPLNLVGDFGGGALYLVAGLLAGLLSARRTGQGQVVDCAMVDGAASLMSMFFDMAGQGQWKDQRQSNMLDGGAPYYGTYACADGRFVAIGAIEPQFHALLLTLLGITDTLFDRRDDPTAWPDLREKLAAIFRTKSQAEWCALLEGTDVCFAPVLPLGEAPSHPHLAARGTFITLNGQTQPAPAPRFSATPSAASPTQGSISLDSALQRWATPRRRDP